MWKFPFVMSFEPSGSFRSRAFPLSEFESGMLGLHGNGFKGKVSATAVAPPPPFITGRQQLWARGLCQLSIACLPSTCKAPSLVPQPPNKQQQSKTKHGSGHSTVYGSCPDQGLGSLVDPPTWNWPRASLLGSCGNHRSSQSPD